MRSFSALVSRIVSVVSRNRFLLIFMIPFVIIVGSGCCPKFQRSGGQPDALLAPDEVREIGSRSPPKKARICGLFFVGMVYPFSPPKAAQTARKPPTGTKGTLVTNRLEYPKLTVTNGTIVTGRKEIFNFQQSGAVAAVTAKAHAEIGKAIFPKIHQPFESSCRYRLSCVFVIPFAELRIAAAGATRGIPRSCFPK